jgi:hypothetical protein
LAGLDATLVEREARTAQLEASMAENDVSLTRSDDEVEALAKDKVALEACAAAERDRADTSFRVENELDQARARLDQAKAERDQAVSELDSTRVQFAHAQGLSARAAAEVRGHEELSWPPKGSWPGWTRLARPSRASWHGWTAGPRPSGAASKRYSTSVFWTDPCSIIRDYYSTHRVMCDSRTAK